jgi:beta-lactamase class A
MELEHRKPHNPAGPSRAIDWRRAESRIRSILGGAGGVRFGLVIKDLGTGRLIEHNARARFASASLVKIPILITLYKDLSDERIRPSEGPVFREELRIGGSGVLKGERSGVKVNLRDLCHLMLQHSDNTATNILADLVGQDHVTSICRDFGWRHTDMVRPVMALELRRRGIENWTTPKEMAEMLEKMHRGELVSRKASDEMLRLMLNPPIDDRIPRYLPRGIDIIHKTGLIHDNAHDVGIVYLPGNQAVLISAFADSIGNDYRSAKIPIARIARVLYEEATPPAAQEPGRRRN